MGKQQPSKRAALATNDPSSNCEHCPAWRMLKTAEGAPQLVQAGIDEGKPAVDGKGNPIWLKDESGRFIRAGLCTAQLPSTLQSPMGIVTFWPQTRSHQGCESKEKHELIYRITARRGPAKE